MNNEQLKIFIGNLLDQNRIIQNKLRKMPSTHMKDYSEMYVMGKIDGYLNILEVVTHPEISVQLSKSRMDNINTMRDK